MHLFDWGLDNHLINFSLLFLIYIYVYQFWEVGVCSKNKAHIRTHTHIHTNTHTHRSVQLDALKAIPVGQRYGLDFVVRVDNLYAGAMSNDWSSKSSSYPSFALDVSGLSPPPRPRHRHRPSSPGQLRSLRLRFVCAFFFTFFWGVIGG